ncbi:MAG TPA: ABC transporter permease, partial [Vicinamibacterales bacterium]|nr:ABC transporter permease [Vicinamibacterales bacterium]
MTFRVALKALARNKMRTALTMLGMIIGVAAVIAMVALGTGAQAVIEDQIKSAGTNLITVSPGSMNAMGVRTGFGNSNRMMPEDADAIRQLPQIEYVSEVANTRSQIIFGNMNWNTSIDGVNIDLPLIRSWPMKYGAFFSPEDVRASAKVCVLGSNVSDNLFGENVDPTGETVRIRNQIFKVLGVMTTKGAGAGGTNLDDRVLAPYTTVMKKLSGNQNLNQILASSRSAEGLAAAAAAVTETMRAQHEIAPGGDDDFT